MKKKPTRTLRGRQRNEPCPLCDSGKKFKHCCGDRAKNQRATKEKVSEILGLVEAGGSWSEGVNDGE